MIYTISVSVICVLKDKYCRPSLFPTTTSLCSPWLRMRNCMSTLFCLTSFSNMNGQKKKKKAKEDRLRAESCVSIREKSCYICLTVKGTSTASASDYLYFITCSYMDVKINSLSLVHLFP